MTVVTQSLSSCKNNSKNDEEKVSTKYRENVLKSNKVLCKIEFEHVGAFRNLITFKYPRRILQL